jgi:AraC family transcriptional regulator of adaptative response / DNA-3-methyladenine glycosylase II
VTHLWPGAAAVADAGAHLPMPGARRAALAELARALASGAVDLDPGSDRSEAERRLRALPGIGPWTTGYVAMRALGDPDAFLAMDAGVRRALARHGLSSDPASAERHSQRWRPWRAYAVQYLWSSLEQERRKR